MELSRQITIISAFGRGHWLAAALAKEDLAVTLIDLSSRLGVWPPEDTEGPFGVFRNERLQDLQNERIFSEDPLEEVPNGFTLWLKEGPLEFKGPLTAFHFERRSWPSPYVDLLSGAGPAARPLSVYRSLDSQKFDRQWILHFAHQWAATAYHPNARAAFHGPPSSLQSSFYVRGATRPGMEKSLLWLREKGVEVLTQTDVQDLSFGSGRSISGLELSGEKQGLFKTDQLLWMLSSEETRFLNEKVAASLFPGGTLEPEWCWLRYRVKLAETPERAFIPLHLVMLNDVHSPWTHENMLVLQRTVLPEQFDAWIRLPTVQRFNKEYLSLRGEALCTLLREKISASEAQVQTYPQEYYYTYSQLGASRFPVYAPEKKAQHELSRFRNLHLDSPECWEQYSWEEMFRHQEKIRGRISQWWRNQLQKYQKSAQGKEDHP